MNLENGETTVADHFNHGMADLLAHIEATKFSPLYFTVCLTILVISAVLVYKCSRKKIHPSWWRTECGPD